MAIRPVSETGSSQTGGGHLVGLGILLSAKEFVVLDSETTGLKDPVGFIEVAVADPEGRLLLNTTIRPKIRIEPGAAKVHGYNAEALTGSPSFKDVYPDLLDAISGKRVIVYNASYDAESSTQR